MKPSVLEELQRECQERHKHDPRRPRTYTKRGTKPPKVPKPEPAPKESVRFNPEQLNKFYNDNAF